MHQLLMFGSAVGAGMINSVAGGGRGVGGAGLARRMGRAVVRRIVIAIGFGMAAALLVKLL